ncbi:MAG: ABC-2 transporter permease [Acholeplasmataceae bacterium]|nr:ABC-2 transporter permease [Acholeplasmataceae bacterium]
MKNLIYKELGLSINKFFYLLPIILGGLLFIPNWIFILVFFYFFWLSVPNIFGSYLQQGDYKLLSVLPIKRKDIATSKIYTMFMIEGLHLGIAVIFGFIHNWIYGSWNFFFDINLAFFGIGILLFGVFNISFFPGYFKTAHFYGKPLIFASITTLIYGFIIEFSVTKYQFVKDIFEGTIEMQAITFSITALLGVLLSYLALRISQKRMMEIDL